MTEEELDERMEHAPRSRCRSYMRPCPWERCRARTDIGECADDWVRAYPGGADYVRTAAAMGLCRQRVAAIEARALLRLRRALAR